MKQVKNDKYPGDRALVRWIMSQGLTQKDIEKLSECFGIKVNQGDISCVKRGERANFTSGKYATLLRLRDHLLENDLLKVKTKPTRKYPSGEVRYVFEKRTRGTKKTSS